MGNSSQAPQTKEAAKKTSSWPTRKNLSWCRSLGREWTIQIKSKSYKHASLANDFLYSCYYIIRSLTSLTWAHRSHIGCRERIWSPRGCWWDDESIYTSENYKELRPHRSCFAVLLPFFTSFASVVSCVGLPSAAFTFPSSPGRYFAACSRDFSSYHCTYSLNSSFFRCCGLPWTNCFSQDYLFASWPDRFRSNTMYSLSFTCLVGLTYELCLAKLPRLWECCISPWL